MHSTDNSIVKRTLHHIRITSIHHIIKHFSRKKYQSDRCTGFGINRIIRQIIINRKSFSVYRTADTACDVHSLFSHIFPEVTACLIKFLILIKRSQFCHCRIHIYCTDTVPYCFFLLIDSRMCLIVFSVIHIHIEVNPASFFFFLYKIIRVLSTLFNEISGQVSVVFFARCFIKTQESQFNFLMSRNSRFLAFFCPKTFLNMFCHALHNMKQTIFACHFIVGCRSLHHMACTV